MLWLLILITAPAVKWILLGVVLVLGAAGFVGWLNPPDWVYIAAIPVLIVLFVLNARASRRMP